MSGKNRLLIAAVAGFFALIAVFHLASARAGHSHYRDQHLGTALEYAKGEIDLLRPIIVGFNATRTPTLLEVPLWQAAAAVLFKILGPWFGWANLLSLAIFATGAFPLYELARHYLGSRGAWWTVLLLLAQPIIVLLSGQASGDGLAFVSALWFLFFAVRLIRTQRAVWLLPCAIFGALSALLKLPLFMSVGLASIFLLLAHAPRSIRAWALLAGTGLVSGLVFLVWSRYTDSWSARAEFPLENLRFTKDSPMWDWYFGSWAFRLNPFNWAKAGWAGLNALFGSFALVALAGSALFFSKNRLAQCWLLGAVLTTLVFTHLVLVHRHYYILFSPAVALLGASAITKLDELLKLGGWRRSFATLGAVGAVFLATVQGLLGIEIVVDFDAYPQRVAAQIREQTKPEDKLLILGGGWGGESLFLAQRDGLSIRDMHLLEEPRSLARLVELGFTKLVLISESPLLNALQQTNPGNLSRQRLSYREVLTAVAEPWTTVFQSEDLLIKDLPRSLP